MFFATNALVHARAGGIETYPVTAMESFGSFEVPAQKTNRRLLDRESRFSDL